VSEPLAGVGGVSAAPATGAPAARPDRPDRPSVAAAGFERMLLMQLTRSLADSAFGDDETTSAASQAYRDMLPDALSQALAEGEGTGVARAFEETLPR
jgi:Rod binding domain-containing protein